MINVHTNNIKYILWKNGVNNTMWNKQLMIWLGVESHRANELLLGTQLNSNESERLTMKFGFNVEDMRLADLISQDGVDILKENLHHLISNLSHGQRSDLSQRLGIHQNTITRWSRGSNRPVRAHIDALCAYFGLPEGVDLEIEPIFLTFPPVTIVEQKVWLFERIGALDNSKLQAIFPALKLMLEERE